MRILQGKAGAVISRKAGESPVRWTAHCGLIRAISGILGSWTPWPSVSAIALKQDLSWLLPRCKKKLAPEANMVVSSFRGVSVFPGLDPRTHPVCPTIAHFLAPQVLTNTSSTVFILPCHRGSAAKQAPIAHHNARSIAKVS